MTGVTREALLVIGGAGPSALGLAALAGAVGFTVAADSGLESCVAAGVVPDLVVGDMDSLTDLSLLRRFPPDRVLRFPQNKDETDTEIGIRVLLERGWTRITIAGGAGGRIDHLLGIAALFERRTPPVRWVTDGADMFLVDGEATFDGWQGSIVSVFPIGGRASELHSKGLRWPLDGLEFDRGFAGISNVAVEDRITIGVGSGKLLVVHSLA